MNNPYFFLLFPKYAYVRTPTYTSLPFTHIMQLFSPPKSKSYFFDVFNFHHRDPPRQELSHHIEPLCRRTPIYNIFSPRKPDVSVICSKPSKKANFVVCGVFGEIFPHTWNLRPTYEKLLVLKYETVFSFCHLLVVHSSILDFLPIIKMVNGGVEQNLAPFSENKFDFFHQKGC